MQFSTIDYTVFLGYIAFIIAMGLFVSREKKGHEKDSSDYFLASRALPWWAVGASLIAANISAEQFIGMSGSGYVIGLAIATYEWTAAIALIVIAKYFLPIFLEKQIYTMPQLLEIRYDSRVRTGLAVFWLLLYVFVNLTSVLYLGALAMRTIMGIPLMWGIVGLATFSAVYSIYGGLKAVAWTDVVQVVVLIGGGLVTSYMALNAISADGGMLAGLAQLIDQAPGKFDMILEPSNPNYKELPGLGVLLGGMWMAHFFYWGCNQYITQRGLAAKSIGEAQKGLVFGGFLKILLPLIVVVPGIAASVLNPDLPKADEAYPWVLSTFVPTGLKGLAFAALIAAIVSSLSSMVNSTSTIFSMDIYKSLIRKDASEKNLVRVGRIGSGVALVIAVLVAPTLKTFEQVFQFIQEFSGFVSPGIFAIFIFGLFWKKTTANAAVWAAVLSIPLSLGIKVAWPDFPFLNRMGVVFLIVSACMIGISLWENKRKERAEDPKGIEIGKDLFHTDMVFNVCAIVICAILAVLYIRFW